jgi:hypothetical protein
MKEQDYTTNITVNATTQEVFHAINNVRGWWTENLEGNSEKLNDEFEVRFGDVHHSKLKLIEVAPRKKVVWLVTESKLNFIKDNQEWTGTKIIFEISGKGDETQVKFTHSGLVPKVECFDACSNAWTPYIQQSLFSLITTGEGNPAPKD